MYMLKCSYSLLPTVPYQSTRHHAAILMPMFDAVPPTTFIAASMSLALRSGSLMAAISRSWSCVMVATLPCLPFGAPLAMPAAFFNNSAAGGVFRMNVKLLSCAHPRASTPKDQQKASYNLPAFPPCCPRPTSVSLESPLESALPRRDQTEFESRCPLARALRVPTTLLLPSGVGVWARRTHLRSAATFPKTSQAG
jgi:hypothetical protein